MEQIKKKTDCVLMIGQSNMAGRGDFGVVEPIESKDILMLRNCRWQQMSEPINPDRGIFSGQYRSGVSLAASFAKRYTEESGNRLGLIPCADGGTSLDSWQPGGVLYENAVFQTRMAMRNSELTAVIWHQGEADVCYRALLDSYNDRFLNMIHSLFKDLGIEPVPVIAGELGAYLERRGGSWSNYAEFNANLVKLTEAEPYIGLAKAAELECRPDILHFTSPSLRILGERYFEEYVKVRDKIKK